MLLCSRVEMGTSDSRRCQNFAICRRIGPGAVLSGRVLTRAPVARMRTAAASSPPALSSHRRDKTLVGLCSALFGAAAEEFGGSVVRGEEGFQVEFGEGYVYGGGEAGDGGDEAEFAVGAGQA